jgi:hypothetical protein
MEFKDLVATKETIDLASGGLVTYDTDVVTSGPGMILTYNPTGKYSMSLVSTFHPGGPVQILMRGIAASGNKKYPVGEIVAKLVLF